MNSSLKPGGVSSSLPLARPDSLLGQIHSLFNSSFNIAFGDELVNVASSQKQCSSYGLVLDEGLFTPLIKSILVGDRVSQKGAQMLIYSTYGGVLEINLDELDVLDLKIRPIQPQLERLQAIDEALESVSWQDEIGLPADERSHAELQKLSNAAMSTEEFYEVFDYLCGRGKGLTPSGDDVLLGYLMVLKLFGKTPILEEWRLNSAIQKTTAISVNYFKMLFRGYVSEYLQNFCQAAEKSDIELLKQSVTAIKQIGATSGSDTLLGISIGVGKIKKLLNSLRFVTLRQKEVSGKFLEIFNRGTLVNNQKIYQLVTSKQIITKQ